MLYLDAALWSQHLQHRRTMPHPCWWCLHCILLDPWGTNHYSLPLSVDTHHFRNFILTPIALMVRISDLCTVLIRTIMFTCLKRTLPLRRFDSKQAQELRSLPLSVGWLIFTFWHSVDSLWRNAFDFFVTAVRHRMMRFRSFDANHLQYKTLYVYRSSKLFHGWQKLHGNAKATDITDLSSCLLKSSNSTSILDRRIC